MTGAVVRMLGSPREAAITQRIAHRAAEDSFQFQPARVVPKAAIGTATSPISGRKRR